MTSPFAIKTTRLEWEDAGGTQKKHRVTNFSVSDPKASMTDPREQVPMGGRQKPRVGALWAEMGFNTELAGSGAAGTPPDNHKLLEASGMVAVVVTSTSCTYTLDGTMRGSYDDGLSGGDTDDKLNIRKCIGNAYEQEIGNARGNTEFILIANQEGTCRHEFKGDYIEPDEATVTSSYGTTADAPVCKGITLTAAGVATLVVKELRINLNNEIPMPRDSMTDVNGTEEAVITDQLPTFTLVIEHPDKSSLNVWNKFTTETKLTITAILGSVAGNTITITFDGYMNAVPEHSERDNLLLTTVTGNNSWATGETTLSIAYT